MYLQGGAGFWKVPFGNRWIVFCKRSLAYPGRFGFAPAGFSGEFCFAAGEVEVSAPVTACTAGAAVAELYSLYRVEVNSLSLEKYVLRSSHRCQRMNNHAVTSSLCKGYDMSIK